MVRLTGVALLLVGGWAQAQIVDFQIVWVVVGDVATSAGDRPVQAGKHLFMANHLADLSLKQVRIARVDADPTVTAIKLGERFCLSSLRISAAGADGSMIKRAPLSVSVRQDHRDTLKLEYRDRDICMRPSAAGEYPVRFASLLPASDGSMRGAQIFLRVADPAVSGGEAEPTEPAPKL
ncbi:hypothetical protein [Povalibacter sp.]|uniref:hypothetical protein n=1 Tax=Povalibacter sp. TaxID=1962978 RepID=UPI002F40E7E9